MIFINQMMRLAGKHPEYIIQYARILQNQLTIFIFDNDDQKIIRDVSEDGRAYKAWENNVFSFVIPVPDHRIATPEICIERRFL